MMATMMFSIKKKVSGFSFQTFSQAHMNRSMSPKKPMDAMMYRMSVIVFLFIYFPC
jgi:hypothetical protein